MRLPDLSGLSLAPTGARATPCDWRFANCVTFYLPDDLFARHADLVRELGLTQESCKVMLSAVESDKARVVSPYETLYGSAWWNMLLIELGIDELQVLLSYYKPLGFVEFMLFNSFILFQPPWANARLTPTVLSFHIGRSTVEGEGVPICPHQLSTTTGITG